MYSCLENMDFGSNCGLWKQVQTGERPDLILSWPHTAHSRFIEPPKYWRSFWLDILAGAQCTRENTTVDIGKYSSYHHYICTYFCLFFLYQFVLLLFFLIISFLLFHFYAFKIHLFYFPFFLISTVLFHYIPFPPCFWLCILASLVFVFIFNYGFVYWFDSSLLFCFLIIIFLFFPFTFVLFFFCEYERVSSLCILICLVLFLPCVFGFCLFVLFCLYIGFTFIF